jgi:hypothetical protein
MRMRPALDSARFSKTKLTIKLDEHLVRPTQEFKARTIASVDPMVQVWAGPSIREATRRLHIEWDGERACQQQCNLELHDADGNLYRYVAVLNVYLVFATAWRR